MLPHERETPTPSGGGAASERPPAPRSDATDTAEHLDRALDDALEATFPASDPLASFQFR